MAQRGANRAVLGAAMTHEEIGKIIGVSRATVGDIERRAMEKIRRMRTPVARKMLGYFECMSDSVEPPEEYRVSDETETLYSQDI